MRRTWDKERVDVNSRRIDNITTALEAANRELWDLIPIYEEYIATNTIDDQTEYLMSKLHRIVNELFNMHRKRDKRIRR